MYFFSQLMELTIGHRNQLISVELSMLTVQSRTGGSWKRESKDSKATD